MILGFPIEFYIASAIAVLLTGISKSGFAGGLGTMAVPIMSLFVAPQLAVTIMMPILVVIDLANIWRYRNDWSRRTILALMPGAMIGLALGAYLFDAVDAEMLKVLVGVLGLVFATQFFARLWADRALAPDFEEHDVPRWMVWLMSALSGFASFVAHAGGPPIKGVLLKQNLQKSRFVGTNSVYFFIINGIKAFAYGGLGQYSWNAFAFSASLAPFLVLGVILGFTLHNLISQKLFTLLAHMFLALSGFKLVWDGLGF